MSYSGTIIADNPCGYYRVNETSGSTLSDESGFARDGSYQGGVTKQQTKLVQQFGGYSAKLDGVNGYLNAGTAVVNATAGTSFTVEAWFVPTDTARKQALFSFNRGANNGPQVYYSHPSFGGAGKFDVFDSTAFNEFSSTSAFTSGTLFVVWRVAADGSTNLRVNGVAQGSAGANSNMLTATADTFQLGMDWDTGPVISDLLAGYVDDLALFPTYLSDADVDQHYAVGQIADIVGVRATATATGQPGTPTAGGSVTVTGARASATATAQPGTVSIHASTVKPLRGVLAVAGNAWANADSAALSLWASRLDWVVFHAPEAGLDENARVALLGLKSSLKTYAYQEFGESVDNASWTTGMSTTQARASGFLAHYSGAEAVAYTGSHSVDMGKAGWGAAIANLVIARMNAFTPRYYGVMFDDVNGFDSRLPNLGLPDGYADSAAYVAAINTQLLAAQSLLQASGYQVAINLGGVSEWQTESFPCDSLAGVVYMTILEHGGIWPDGSVEGSPIPERITAIAAAMPAGKILNLNSNASTDYGAVYMDNFIRTIGAQSGSYGPYAYPFYWNSVFEQGSVSSTPLTVVGVRAQATATGQPGMFSKSGPVIGVQATATATGKPGNVNILVPAQSHQPVTVLRVALNSQPFATTISYVDLSNRLLGFTTERGRADELVEFDTGQATFTMKDDDRQLDPANSSGTYFGKLTPRRRFNCQAVWGGTTYDLFTGFNQNWKPEWNSKHARLGVPVTDGFGLFANDSFSGWTINIPTTGGTPPTTFASDLPRPVETTDARIGWILDKFGWPQSWRQIDNGYVTAKTEVYHQNNTLDALQEMEKTEGGYLYAGTTGNLVFQNKYARVGGSVTVVFGENPGEIPYTAWDYEPQDVDHLMNHVTTRVADQPSDSPIEYELKDASSIGTYGAGAAYTFELQANSNTEAEARGQYYLGRYATPTTRVNSVTIKPITNPSSMWPVALGLKIGDRVRVKQRFYGTGATLAHDAFIEGVRHDVDPREWQTTFKLSPVVSGVDTASYFKLDQSGMDSSATVIAF